MITAVALVATGAVALVFAPQPARAESVEPGIKPDVVLNPGDSINVHSPNPLVGAAAVTFKPAGCRSAPGSATCQAFRIRIPQKKPGYFLRISTLWTGESAAGAVSAPDMDTYLYFTPDAYFDTATYGGAGGADPEQVLIPEKDIKQTEYDFVVQAFLGAVNGFDVQFEYVNSSKGPTPAKADITLDPNTSFTKTYQSVITGYTGAPLLYPLVNQKPDDCRNNPANGPLCDVYRLKLHRDTSDGALNLVVLELNWQARYSPPINASATAFPPIQIPNIDIMVWDAADHQMERVAVGGQGGSVPERASFLAAQNEYDVVIQVEDGVTSSYTLKATLTNQKFPKQNELLDQSDTTLGDTVPPTGVFDNLGPSVTPTDNSVPDLGLAPINADPDIAGIGLGVDEQFNGNQISLGGAVRNTAAIKKPPSGLALVLGMVLFPLVVVGLAVAFLRRRRNALI